MAYAKIRPKRGTKSQWENANTVLAEGELGIEVPDAGIGKGQVKVKQGDGSTPWNELPYAIDLTEFVEHLEDTENPHETTAEQVGAHPGVTIVTTAGTSLNDYMEEGEYFFPKDFTPVDIPEGVNGWLSVRHGAEPDGDGGYYKTVKQIWYRLGTAGINDYRTKVRTYADTFGWGEWTRYLTSKEVAFTLTELGITEFPTTMSVVADAMSDNSVLIIDSRYIVAGGTQEISDLGLANAGMYMFFRGTSNARVSLLNIYGATGATTSYMNYGCYADTDKKVIWILGERQNSKYPDCRFRTAEDGNTEWINPPMVAGVEYRTTERWDGRPVFTQNINCGQAADKKTVSYLNPEQIHHIIRFAGKVGGVSVPSFNANDFSNAYSAQIMVGTVSATIRCGASLVGAQTYLQIWYVKGAEYV